MNEIDEFSHLSRLLAGGQASPVRSFVYGHIAHYDPQLNRVQCVIPSMSGTGGIPVMTGWMPLSSQWVGAGFGFQVAPLGGATFENPTNGEQVKIGILDPNYGSFTAELCGWTLAQLPPDQALAPGEAILQDQHGSLIKFGMDQSITITTSLALNINAGGDVNAIVEGSLSANVTGQAAIDAATIVLAGGGPPVARVGDQVKVGAVTGTIISGSSKVTCG